MLIRIVKVSPVSLPCLVCSAMAVARAESCSPFLLRLAPPSAATVRIGFPRGNPEPLSSVAHLENEVLSLESKGAFDLQIRYTNEWFLITCIILFPSCFLIYSTRNLKRVLPPRAYPSNRDRNESFRLSI